MRGNKNNAKNSGQKVKIGSVVKGINSGVKNGKIFIALR